MKPKKLKLAKLELNLFTLLEEANREFTAIWKSCQNPDKKQKSFKNCAQSYEKIIELIKYNRKRNNVSDLLESYYLEARLGKIQSHLNDLPQNPSNEDVVLSNDEKIEELTESLNRLNSRTKDLNLHGKKNIAHALRKDYRELFNKIEEYSLSWHKTISERKATYYYNCAESLIEETTSKNSDYDLKINLFESAIACLDFSAFLYVKAEATKDAEETSDYKNEIEEQLEKLKKHPKKTLKRKTLSANKPEKSSSPINSSKAFKSSHPVPSKNQTGPSNNDTFAVPSTLPPKKRKNWIIADEEPASKKSNIAPGVNITTSILLKSEEEMIQQREEQYKKMLTHSSVDDPFRFYSRLFFDLSHRLQVFSKESSNHTLLTQLSWLTIAKQLMGLTSNKNAADNTDIEKIANNISLLSTANQKNLKTISSQKRAEAYPTYAASYLQSRDLQNLLIEEISDYYYGLEAFNLKAGAMSFLDLIPNIIKKHSFANTLKEIENTIQSVYKPIENLFYAKLLRELVKFHICKENTHWQENTFSPEKKAQLNKEYLRILTISERFAEGSSNEQRELKHKIQQLKMHLSPEQSLTLPKHTYPASHFFQSPTQIEPLSTELLNTTLREHFQCLVKCRASSIHSETIYNHLLQFIQTHCQQAQTAISHSRVLQL